MVQRKPGHLPYHIDPHALSSLLVRPFHPPSDEEAEEEGGREQHVISAFSTDPYLRSLARHEYCPDGSDPSFLTGVLYECLSKHKPQLLHLHLGLAAQCRGLPTMPTHHAACTVRRKQKMIFVWEGKAETRSIRGRALVSSALQYAMEGTFRIELERIIIN